MGESFVIDVTRVRRMAVKTGELDLCASSTARIDEAESDQTPVFINGSSQISS